MSIIYRIKELAEAHGHTLASIERALGLGHGTIRKWEVASPSSEKLKKVADFLSTTMDYLFAGEGGKVASLSDEALDVAREWQALDSRSQAKIRGDIYKYADEGKLNEQAEEFHIGKKAT